MVTITAMMVKKLRERTGVGVMECKKALEAVGGGIEQAVELLRKAGKAKAELKKDRIAAEGRIILACSQHEGILIEANCETDFVSRDKEFMSFCETLGKEALLGRVTSLSEIMKLSLNKQSVLETQEMLISKIGENIRIRRVEGFFGDNFVYGYLHGNARIGVLVEIDKNNHLLGKDLALHIAASNPMAISASDMPAELINKEREIYLAQMKDSGKPDNILTKIIEGKISKFIDEHTLEGQTFVKDGNVKVINLLKQHNTRVLRMVRFELGEGIVKDAVDFAAEVEAQVTSCSR